MNKTKTNYGTVFWITGLSGAGKTTIGKALYKKLSLSKSIVMLDGDELRQVFGDDLGYEREDRQKSAFRNARLCALLSNQGIDVICCTISMFDNVRSWNRNNIKNYMEIYIKVNKSTLIQRNQKGLYSEKQGNLVGFGIDMEEPKHPNLVIENEGKLSEDEIVNIICDNLKCE